jgi:integrase
MRLDDIQFTSRVWTPPGARAHGGRNHELPLSDFALEILAVLPRSKKRAGVPGRTARGHASDRMVERGCEGEETVWCRGLAVA